MGLSLRVACKQHLHAEITAQHLELQMTCPMSTPTTSHRSELQAAVVLE